jgi:hypothetical protein
MDEKEGLTQKQAYCCLNCTNLPPCKAAAGNCVECCEDCGDTSMCRSTAYFGKDDKIYKKYRVTYTISSYYCFGTCPAGSRESNPPYSYVYQTNAAWTGLLDSEYPDEYEIFGFDSYIELNYYCEIDINGYEYEYDNSSTNRTKTYNGRSGTVDIWQQCGPNQSNENGIEAIPTFPSPTKDAKDYECGLPYRTDPNDNIYITSTVDFIQPLKTYNNKGEIVADPTPGTPYNPCSPIRTASAPGCHFFHP